MTKLKPREDEQSAPVAPEADPTVEQAELLSSDQVKELQEKYEALEAQEGELPVIDVEFESLSNETRAEIIRLEGEYNTALEQADFAAARSRLDVLREFGSKLAELGIEAGKKALELLDLDTKEKAMEALLEVIPYVGAVYAVTGKRIKIEKGADGLPRPQLEDISWTDRGIYLAGELIVSGHIFRGIKDAILKKGAKAIATEIGKAVAARGGEVLVKRAKKGAEKILDKAVEETKEAKKAS
ncbi:MAG: hypothetical protein ABH846_00515 [Patescibacteria group bacterium]